MIVVAGVLAGIYFLIPKARNGTATAAAPESAAQAPVAPATAAHPLAKDVELTGIRITEGRNQRVQVRFIAVNHSAAELPETKLHVTLKRGGQEDIMDFPFTLPSLGPHESREITANTRTRLRGYEMPDWQFISVEFTDPEGQPAR